MGKGRFSTTEIARGSSFISIGLFLLRFLPLKTTASEDSWLAVGRPPSWWVKKKRGRGVEWKKQGWGVGDGASFSLPGPKMTDTSIKFQPRLID